MLICGIASIVLAFGCGVGFIPGIVAVVLAGGAQREIEDSGGRLTGAGLVKAGRICGIGRDRAAACWPSPVIVGAVRHGRDDLLTPPRRAAVR